MIGHRINFKDAIAISQPGDYWKDEKGRWFIKCPTGLIGMITAHHVEEHEDGTITVTPSIVIDDGHTKWHGWLTKGEWTD